MVALIVFGTTSDTGIGCFCGIATGLNTSSGSAKIANRSVTNFAIIILTTSRYGALLGSRVAASSSLELGAIVIKLAISFTDHQGGVTRRFGRRKTFAVGHTLGNSAHPCLTQVVGGKLSAIVVVRTANLAYPSHTNWGSWIPTIAIVAALLNASTGRSSR